MKNNVATKIILLPVIVTLLITLALIFIEGNFEEWKASHIFGLFIILFSSIYFFTILFVLPLYFFFMKKFKNVLFSLLILNILGVFIIGSIDFGLITLFEVKSIYMIYPLFSIVSLVRSK